MKLFIGVFWLVSGLVMNTFGQEYYYAAENMLDVNTATFDELILLPGINRYQAYKIIEYRRVFGYFLTLDELLKVEGLSLQDVASWQSYITVMAPKARGAPQGSLKFKTVKTGNVEGGEYQFLHGRWKNFQPGWSGAMLLEQYPHYAGYRVAGSKAANGYWSQRYLLNKYYLLWEPNSVVKKLLVGDYLAGFGEGVAMDLTGRSKPNGIYPGDLEATEYNTAKISNHALLQAASYKSSKSFRGIAMVLEQDQFKETVFYSGQNNAYYGFYINGSTIRKPLEHYFSEQVSGLDITTYVWGETEIGVTGFYSQRETKGPDPWRYPAEDKNFLVFGTHINSYIGRLNLCGEIGKVNKYGEGIFTEGNVNFGRINYSASYRKYDLDYYNPHAGSYSRHYPQSVFRCRDECGVLGKIAWQILSNVKVTASFDQYTHQAQ
ncbi:MAG: helix-hairpin-helix domain-containing protein, partial [Elusimicrobia bacterium]|nr:helix-hairpin-helix domain-containing protein [Elusimicrobiota bacterium]